MSVLLFSQDKSSENLIHAILPLGLGLLATAVFFGGFPSQDLIIALTTAVSVGGLFLYMSGMDSVLVKRHYRNRINKNQGQSIQGAFRKWNTYGSRWHGTANVEDYAEAMVALAISSTPIGRRLWRVRAYWYFMLSYWFYVGTGYVYYGRALANITDPASNTVAYGIGIMVIVFAFLGYLGLLYEKGRRRFYTLYLERDIRFMAEFLYLQMILDHFFLKGSYNPQTVNESPQSQIREEIRFLEQVLVRHDMDLFAVMWENILDKLGTYEDELRRGMHLPGG